MEGSLKSITEGLKSAPSCLAAVILIGVLAYLVHVGRNAEEARAHERFMKILGECNFIGDPKGRENFGGTR